MGNGEKPGYNELPAGTVSERVEKFKGKPQPNNVSRESLDIKQGNTAKYIELHEHLIEEAAKNSTDPIRLNQKDTEQNLTGTSPTGVDDIHSLEENTQEKAAKIEEKITQQASSKDSGLDGQPSTGQEKSILNRALNAVGDLAKDISAKYEDISSAEDRLEVINEKAESVYASLSELTKSLVVTAYQGIYGVHPEENYEKALSGQNEPQGRTKESLQNWEKRHEIYSKKPEILIKRDMLKSFVEKSSLSLEDKEMIIQLLNSVQQSDRKHAAKDISLQSSQEHREYMQTAVNDDNAIFSESPEHLDYYMTISPPQDVENPEHNYETQAKTPEELYNELESKGFTEEKKKELIKAAITTQQQQKEFDNIRGAEPQKLKSQSDFEGAPPRTFKDQLISDINPMKAESKAPFDFESIAEELVLISKVRCQLIALKKGSLSPDEWAQEARETINQCGGVQTTTPEITKMQDAHYHAAKNSFFKKDVLQLKKNMNQNKLK